MICIRICTSDVIVFDDSLLTRIHSEKADRGLSTIFGDTNVSVEGENLTLLFHDDCKHRAMEIVEADRTVVMTAEEFCVVSRILMVAPQSFLASHKCTEYSFPLQPIASPAGLTTNQRTNNDETGVSSYVW